ARASSWLVCQSHEKSYSENARPAMSTGTFNSAMCAILQAGSLEERFKSRHEFLDDLFLDIEAGRPVRAHCGVHVINDQFPIDVGVIDFPAVEADPFAKGQE